GLAREKAMLANPGKAVSDSLRAGVRVDDSLSAPGPGHERPASGLRPLAGSGPGQFGGYPPFAKQRWNGQARASSRGADGSGFGPPPFAPPDQGRQGQMSSSMRGGASGFGPPPFPPPGQGRQGQMSSSMSRGASGFGPPPFPPPGQGQQGQMPQDWGRQSGADGQHPPHFRHRQDGRNRMASNEGGEFEPPPFPPPGGQMRQRGSGQENFPPPYPPQDDWRSRGQQGGPPPLGEQQPFEH
ncbi:MAG TPA: hypothetical protein V6C72_13945, partial [Chroococcales cyanobacterium]